MTFWRNLPPFDRRNPNRKKRRGSPSLDGSKTIKTPQRRKSDMPVYPSYRSKPRKSPFKRLIKRLFWYGAGIALLFVAWFSYDLPDIESLNQFTKAPSIVVKSEDGQIVGSSGDVYGDYIGFDDLPTSLVDAVMATEDRNFYHHYGIDPFGLARAMVVNMRSGRIVQGGSTITQQVAKNVFLTPERSIGRKIREALLAIKLENRFSKQDIMSIYLNRVYLGAGNYGIDAASRRYFDKSGRELTLAESAIIAGLLKAPSRFAPTSNPTLSKQRAEQVLLNMQEAGYLTEEQVTKAKEEIDPALNTKKRTAQSALYFTDWILDQLPEYVGNIEEDIVVISTLKPEWQAMAEKAITEVMDKEGETHMASQAALLSMTPDGAVRAMIGGRNYAASQFNRTTQSLRQPGSSFKLFVYLAGLEAGLSPDSQVEDEPITLPIVGGNWSPKNYTGKYLGLVSVRQAVAESINTVSVIVAVEAGLERVIDMARRLGITSDLIPVPSIALGSTEVTLLELTTAYAHLAAEGAMVTPYAILEIQTSAGAPLYKRQSSGQGVALSTGVVHTMNELLMGVVESGTGRGAAIGRPVAGKTGTTSDYRDAWFIGYTPSLVTGVWVGNDDNSAMKKVTGGMLPAMIWRGYMANALAGTPVQGIPTGGGFFQQALPWQQGGVAEFPQQPGEGPGNNDDVKLGPSFWDKLLR